jgi:ferrous iron transport protein A
MHADLMRFNWFNKECVAVAYLMDMKRNHAEENGTEQNGATDKALAPRPLSELHVGESGTIVGLDVKGAIRRRFLEMGMVTGETVRMERIAPLGDPIAFRVKGYQLSMRKSEASKILVAAG